ncbi:MAG: hypothetical protein K8R99_09905 [Actinomycetia bacterium]|nr:hypothetical protein [Actinomycetes bacterium]
MNDRRLEESWWLLSRSRGVGVVLRVLILVSPVAAIACTRLAADHSLLAINVAIIPLAFVCVVYPDSHIGLLVVLLVGIEWLVTVDDQATPWSIGVAISLTVFHASVAAATVAPPAARWTRAMCWRWSRRSLVVMGASACTWAAVAAIDRYAVGSSAVLVVVSLATIAVAAMWARDGSVGVSQQ